MVLENVRICGLGFALNNSHSLSLDSCFADGCTFHGGDVNVLEEVTMADCSVQAGGGVLVTGSLLVYGSEIRANLGNGVEVLEGGVLVGRRTQFVDNTGFGIALGDEDTLCDITECEIRFNKLGEVFTSIESQNTGLSNNLLDSTSKKDQASFFNALVSKDTEELARLKALKPKKVREAEMFGLEAETVELVAEVIKGHGAGDYALEPETMGLVAKVMNQEQDLKEVMSPQSSKKRKRKDGSSKKKSKKRRTKRYEEEEEDVYMSESEEYDVGDDLSDLAIDMEEEEQRLREGEEDSDEEDEDSE